MDTSDRDDIAGASGPAPVSLPSETAAPSGAPVEAPRVDASAGAREPLVVVEKPRPVKLKPKQRAFLAALAKTGNPTAAEKKSKVTRQSDWNWRTEVDAKGHPTELSALYNRLREEAMEHAADLLEIEARRRAEKGTLKPVFYEGEECGTIREYSDRLMEFLLKATRPEKYRERHEVVGAGGKPLHPDKIQHEHTHRFDYSKFTDDELDALAPALALLAKRGGAGTVQGQN